MKVAVSSRSFSKDEFLRTRLLLVYRESYFNEKGVAFAEDELIDFLKDADAAIIGLEKITESVLQRLPKLKLISKYGVGIDNLDLTALKKYNVKVGYTPGVNRRGVAELALQMMMTVTRRSNIASVDLRNGLWAPKIGRNLSEKKVGILGLGNVGKELVRLLQPFNCRISACDSSPDYVFMSDHNVSPVSPQDLFRDSDVVSIHIPLSERNTRFVDKKLLDLLPSHAVLINTARGGIVDELELFRKLQHKEIWGAAFDVFCDEPPRNVELLSLENFYGTPHIGGSSSESIRAMGLAAIEGLSEPKDINSF